ncbi:hypothetical protein GOD70_25965 [Sinorhizobium medicae]|nr:hypothetical protein [Sinorhizobium medicae]MDX0789922.1 hypothetical protein [Sinorhizobium medicae]
MSNQDDVTPANDTPRRRLYTLLRFATSSLLVGFLAAAISSSMFELWHRVYPRETVKVWQLQKEQYNQVIASLEQSDASLVNLEKLVAANPEATALVEKLKASIGDAQSVIQSAPSVEKAADAGISFDIITKAYAQDATVKPAEDQDYTRWVLFSLIALVAFVLVAFSLMYMYTQDKTKKAFAEKTITTIIGFIFGLITGQMSGKLK